MLLNHMSTKVNGNTCFRLAGTQNTQFLTHWLLTTPSCMLRALHAPGCSSNLSLTTPCIYGQKSIRCPTSTAAPWVTCSSRKPHNDAIWEPGLLVQDAQPAYRTAQTSYGPRRLTMSQHTWNRESSPSSAGTVSFLHVMSLHPQLQQIPSAVAGALPQYRATWLSQQLFLSCPTQERETSLIFQRQSGTSRFTVTAKASPSWFLQQ